MLFTLIKKELFINFQEARIQILTIAMIVLSLVVTVLGIFEYKEGIERYQVEQQANLESIKSNLVYATLKPKAIRPPEPLSILSQGVEANLGNTVTFDLLNIPYEAKKMPGSNPYVTEFVKLDISKILLWLFSLTALLVSFDAISRERENGTLKLICASQVPRVQVFWSKFIAATITMSVVIAAVFGLIIVVFLVTPWIQITAALLSGLLMYFIVSLLYVLIWISLGIFISLIAHSSATALLISLAGWVTLMIVIPASIKAYMGPTHFNQEKARVRELQQEIMSDYGKKHYKIWNKTVGSLISNLEFSTMGGGPDYPPVIAPNLPTMEAIQKLQHSLTPLKIDYADKKYRVAESHFIQPYKEKVRLIQKLAYLSPVTLLEMMFMKIAKTSYSDYFRYFGQAIQYRNQVLNYFHSKNALKSYRWFALEPIPFSPSHPVYPKDTKNITKEEWQRMMAYKTKISNDPQFKKSLADFPIFSFKSKRFMDIQNEVLVSILVINFAIGIFIILGLLRMQRYRLSD